MDGELTFMHCDHVPCCTGSVDKIFDGYCSIQFMASGGVYLDYGDRPYNMVGAWVWSVWPGPHIVFHAAEDVSHWDHRYIAFRGASVASWLEAGLLPQKPMPVGRIAALAQDFDKVLGYARRSDRGGRDIAEHLVEAMLLVLKEGGYGTPKGNNFLAAVDEWLYDNRFQKPDYASLACHLGMGQSTVRRKLREQTGQSLHARFLKTRMETARLLISDRSIPIKEVAHMLGFNDVYYFSKQFRTYVGVPPATFRRSIQ